jgi:PadR family transcriptional regulator PadR
VTEPVENVNDSTEATDPIEPHTRKFRKELNAGTVSLVLLAVLDHADRPMYGYEIAKQLESVTKGPAPIKQGPLYPVLRSMERTGLLESIVEPSVAGPPRRYYSVTDAGREGLKSWKSIWTETRALVDAILKGKHLG